MEQIIPASNPPAAGESPIPADAALRDVAFAPGIAKAVADRVDSMLAGKPVRFVTTPRPGPKIRQLYRVEKMGPPVDALNDATAALCSKVGEDFALQLIVQVDRNPGKELVSWMGDIPHSVALSDYHNGTSVSVRVLGNYDPYTDRLLVRFDAIYRAISLPGPTVTE
jgi:hypothetical protein